MVKHFQPQLKKGVFEKKNIFLNKRPQITSYLLHHPWKKEVLGLPQLVPRSKPTTFTVVSVLSEMKLRSNEQNAPVQYEIELIGV